MVYFLSDAHLGSRAIPDAQAHQQRVIEMLNSMAKDATAICLLGDMFDFWYEYIYPPFNGIPRGKRQYEPFLNCLKQLTDKGISVHYFIGNHDIWTFGWLARHTGVTIHREPQTMTFYHKRLFLAHGDGLIPADYMQSLPPHIQKKVRAFIRLRRFFHNPVAQFLFRFVPPCLGDAFGYEWARRSRLKELRHPYPYKGENREELVLFAKEREQQHDPKTHADYYIFGHRHIKLDIPVLSDSRLLILGDCFRQWTYARLTPEGEMTLYDYK
jgi:UDP-2,3-diacylglucosamine hydrolase